MFTPGFGTLDLVRFNNTKLRAWGKFHLTGIFFPFFYVSSILPTSFLIFYTNLIQWPRWLVGSHTIGLMREIVLQYHHYCDQISEKHVRHIETWVIWNRLGVIISGILFFGSILFCSYMCTRAKGELTDSEADYHSSRDDLGGDFELLSPDNTEIEEVYMPKVRITIDVCD